jgi:hypothetical protein
MFEIYIHLDCTGSHAMTTNFITFTGTVQNPRAALPIRQMLSGMQGFQHELY